MILHPAVLALLTSSLLSTLMLLLAVFTGIKILRYWDLESGSELQLILERRTYLVSTLLANVLGFELISLFLFIFTADHLHRLFVGAMCAAGTLNANVYGYPTLILKILTFLAAGLWLILNYVDTKAYDYPLIKVKYRYLLFMTPLVLAEMIVQGLFLLGLKPNIITSCCGSLFSTDASGLAADVAALPVRPAMSAFFLAMLLTTVVGVTFYRRGRGGYWFAFLSGSTFMVSLAAMISFISLYIYQLPSHHCPFDILQYNYGFIGYPIYLALLGAAILGMGVGLLMPFRHRPSLRSVVPDLQRRMTLLALILFFFVTTATLWEIFRSNLTLLGP